MPATAIPSHVWALVLPHLQNPVPDALSAPEDRSVLRQPALARASRVSRLFQIECYKILYKHILTDSLPTLFRDFQTPSVRQRFANTRTLHIEYKEKGQHAVYQDLILRGRGLWDAYGQDEEAAERQLMLDCGREVWSLASCLAEANAFGALPQLETVAVDSIYGATSTTWTHYSNLKRGPDGASDDNKTYPYELLSVRQFDIFLFKCPNLRHLCFRDSFGPLSTLGASHNSQREERPYAITIHVPHKTIQTLPFALGCSKIRYCLGSPSEINWCTDLGWLETNLRGESRLRKTERDAHKAHSPTCKGFCGGAPANIEIYNSASLYHGRFNPTINTFNLPYESPRIKPVLRTLTIADQTKMVGVLGNIVQDFMRRDSGVQDVVKWRRSDETPICEACGTGPPGRLQGWTPDGLEQD